ncbi:PD40 domain-containing protein [Aquimarina agarivorans]|uniref:PD40 domain-containing protein n=1 Tax=Aquimarina agarivorans TaxID=980584 RepID=UPI000248F5E6|nr:PD40 domain-containing protein [Aquimarina agarivorans]
MKKSIYLFFTFITFYQFLIAQENTQWLHLPAISPDGTTIAFSYHGDIYTVPSAGGKATILTISDAYDHTPVWSSDGSQIAFASN